MKRLQILQQTGRFFSLVLLYYLFFVLGSLAVSGKLPDVASEPGLLPGNMALLVIGVANTLLVIALVKSSRWHGWKLALSLAFAYYGAVTLLTQIETWYFLSDITVNAELLPRLFMMGLPVAFVYVPLAVWILGRWRKPAAGKPGFNPALDMPAGQWGGKLMLIAVAYLILYWGAGYFIAWQNPELRTFYGSPGEILSFREHTVLTLRTDPGLFLFQLFRAMLWTLCGLAIIRGSKLSAWSTAVLLGLLFSLPQNISHIMENPLMPVASVRLSHMIETASSTFIFGLMVVWLLHREHSSVRDWFGLEKRKRTQVINIPLA